MMTFDKYVLPDGTIVEIDAELARGMNVITFTLKGGKVVNALRKDVQ